MIISCNWFLSDVNFDASRIAPHSHPVLLPTEIKTPVQCPVGYKPRSLILAPRKAGSSVRSSPAWQS